MFFIVFYICARFRIALIGGNLTGKSRERRSCKLSPPPERPVQLARRLSVNGGVTIQVKPILQYFDTYLYSHGTIYGTKVLGQ